MTKTVFALAASLILCVFLSVVAQVKISLQNKQLTVRARGNDGAYEILSRELQRPVLISQVGAKMDREWVTSSDYLHHETTEATFQDVLDSGHILTTTFSGLVRKLELICLLRLH